jgi:hypothetical protein
MAQSDEPEARRGSHVDVNGSAVDSPSSPPKSTQAELVEVRANTALSSLASSPCLPTYVPIRGYMSMTKIPR